jgi:hypothetical protein
MVGTQGVRIFGLGADGSPRELAAGSFGERTVQDLAMDREGGVFVAFSDDREVWKIDPAGTAARHARIPAAARERPGSCPCAWTPPPGTSMWETRPASGGRPPAGR